MKKIYTTGIRNKLITGKNSASYNEKHPENPISMRPIHDALTTTRDGGVARRLRFIGTHESRAEIARILMFF
jgi:hypothetical protein